MKDKPVNCVFEGVGGRVQRAVRGIRGTWNKIPIQPFTNWCNFGQVIVLLRAFIPPSINLG